MVKIKEKRRIKRIYFILAREDGTKQNKFETAKKMFKEKLDINLIEKITGLSKKELETLQ